MSSKLVKPANCTCRYPEVICRNMIGHDDSCPVAMEWYKENAIAVAKRAVIEAAKEWRQDYAEHQASKWTALGAVVSFESNLRQSEASLIKALEALIKAEEGKS